MDLEFLKKSLKENKFRIGILKNKSLKEKKNQEKTNLEENPFKNLFKNN